MTTIATDGKSMAGDSLATAGTMIVRYAPKVSRASDGRIFGCSGDVTDVIQFCDWMSGGDKPIVGENFSALILNSDGSVDWIDKNLVLVRYSVPTGIGSGCEIAIGAMLAGADPKRAVELAATIDRHTGGEVTVEHLNALREVA